MADMSYQERIGKIETLTADELGQLEKDITEAFGAAETSDDLDAMSAAADALDLVRAAQANLANAENTETAEVGTKSSTGSPDTPPGDAASADAAVPSVAPTPVAAAAETAQTAEPATAADGASALASVDALADALVAAVAKKLPAALAEHQFKAKDEPEDEPKKKEEPEDGMTASSTEETAMSELAQTDLPAERQPIVATSVTTILAGADIPQRAAGSEFGSYSEVSEAFVARLGTLRGSRGGDGDKCIVASVQSTVDPSRELRPGDDVSNYAKVDEVIRAMKQVDRTALVASGGYCAPLETRYDIFGVGVADRPVRDSLAGFQSTRGGIRYVSPPVLSSFSSAVGLWTAANDANPTSPSTKPFMTVACQPEVTATADAVTLELQFGNLMSRAYPELVARNNELGLIYHARFAEQTLLSKISGLSTAVSSTFSLGTARDFLNALGKAASAYRHRHRMNEDDALRVMAPVWVLEAMREDLTRGYPGDQIEWADSMINAALAARNINITWHLDDPLQVGAQAAGALNDWPATIKWYIFAEGTFLFLDGGTLDLGIVRDTTLVNTNDYRMFVETFEGVAKVGVESIVVTTTTHVTGSITGTTSP